MTGDKSPSCTLVEPVFKEPFCPRKCHDAKCRVFTRVRTSLRGDPGERKGEKLRK